MKLKSKKQNNTDQNVILFVIGVLLSAVIATSAFLICVKTLDTNNNNINLNGYQLYIDGVALSVAD